MSNSIFSLSPEKRESPRRSLSPIGQIHTTRNITLSQELVSLWFPPHFFHMTIFSAVCLFSWIRTVSPVAYWIAMNTEGCSYHEYLSGTLCRRNYKSIIAQLAPSSKKVRARGGANVLKITLICPRKGSISSWCAYVTVISTHKSCVPTLRRQPHDSWRERNDDSPQTQALGYRELPAWLTGLRNWMSKRGKQLGSGCLI